MLSCEGTTILIKHYQSQVQMFLNNYVFSDDSVIYTAVFFGIFACKTVYDVSRLVSHFYFKSYLSLSRHKQIEWNNRAMSTFMPCLLQLCHFTSYSGQISTLMTCFLVQLFFDFQNRQLLFWEFLLVTSFPISA